jgi:hypothetical protein
MTTIIRCEPEWKGKKDVNDNDDGATTRKRPHKTESEHKSKQAIRRE